MLVHFLVVGLLLTVANAQDDKESKDEKKKKLELEMVPLSIDYLEAMDPFSVEGTKEEPQLKLSQDYTSVLVELMTPGLGHKKMNSCEIISSANNPEDPEGPIYKSYLTCVGFGDIDNCTISPGTYKPKTKCDIAIPKDDVEGVKDGSKETSIYFSKFFLEDDLGIQLAYASKKKDEGKEEKTEEGGKEEKGGKEKKGGGKE